MKIELAPVIAPDSFEQRLEEELVSWFERNFFRPLQAIFYVDRPNAVAEAPIESWSEFPDFFESLRYPRANLPQIQSDERDALISYLDSRGIGSTLEFVRPGTLRPTQAMYSHSKLAAARAHHDPDRPLLASSDRRILDGHHQWLKDVLDDPDGRVLVIVFHAKIDRLIRESNLFPGTVRLNEVRNNAAPDFGELIAALNSGRISFADGVLSGRFSAITSKTLRKLGAKFNRDDKTYRIAQTDLPYNLRGAIAAAKARVATIQTTLVDTAADLAAKITASPTLGLKLSNFTSELVANLETQFLDSVATAANEAPEAIDFVATPPDLTPSMVADFRETLTENLELSIKTFTDLEVVRIRELAEENFINGGRVDRLQDMIEARFQVTKNKAKFLARQETSMIASEFARARAQEIGSTEYIWHTRHDDRVRHDHQELNGTTQLWDDPPVVDKATDRRRNPGMDYNCRCVARALLNLQARRVA